MDGRIRALIGIDVAAALGVVWAFAGSHDGDSVGGIRIFALCVLIAYLLNIAAFVPSYRARTEHYYDLTGSATYLSTVVVAFVATDERDLRTILLAAMVVIWALRLGTFLFARVRRAGKDGRFDAIKQDWARFLLSWALQALWVTITAGAAIAAITTADKMELGAVGVLGIVVWAGGFGVEIIADRQKSDFRRDDANAGRFITSGLWAWSRHPNYFGEFTLWVGIALLALPALSGWQHLTLLSPVFVYALLTRVSGVPLLEKRADDRWGGDPEYEAYKAATPVFFPRPPRSAT